MSLRDTGALSVMATHDDALPHTEDCNADNCMRERLRYMREQGGANFQFTYGKARFSGPTIRERQQKIISDAAKEGRSVRVVNPLYDRTPSTKNQRKVTV